MLSLAKSRGLSPEAVVVDAWYSSLKNLKAIFTTQSNQEGIKRQNSFVLHSMDLTINSRLVIPSKELKWRFSRSSGPGGQGVNTTDSKVEVVFDICRSSAIGPFHKQRLLERLENRCVNGCLNIVASEERSQYQNRQLAMARLVNLLREGLKPPPKERKATKPTRASQKRRVATKKHRSALKQKRQNKPSTDD